MVIEKLTREVVGKWARMKKNKRKEKRRKKNSNDCGGGE